MKPRAVGARADAHGAALGRELARIREQVDEDLGQARPVAVESRQVFGQVDLERLAALREQRPDQGARILEQLVERMLGRPGTAIGPGRGHRVECVSDGDDARKFGDAQRERADAAKEIGHRLRRGEM